MKTTLTLLALTICGAMTLHAADAEKPKKPGAEGKRPDPEEIFKKLDANNDKVVSKEEYLANPRAKQDPAKAEARYKELAKSSPDKGFTLEEFKAGMTGKKGGAAPKKPGDAPAKPAEAPAKPADK